MARHHRPLRADEHVAFDRDARAAILLDHGGIAAERHDKGARLVLRGERGGATEQHCGKRFHLTLTDLSSSFCFIANTTSIPFVTCPKTFWTPSTCHCSVWQIKNCVPPVTC